MELSVMKLLHTAESIQINSLLAVITVNKDFFWKNKKVTFISVNQILVIRKKLLANKDTLNQEV